MNAVRQVLNMNVNIDKKGIGLILSSICRCENSSQYDCTSHELGQVFPGQVLVIKLGYINSQNDVCIRCTVHIHTY